MWFQLLKLKHDKPLSNVASDGFNLSPYIEVSAKGTASVASSMKSNFEVGGGGILSLNHTLASPLLFSA